MNLSENIIQLYTNISSIQKSTVHVHIRTSWVSQYPIDHNDM